MSESRHVVSVSRSSASARAGRRRVTALAVRPPAAPVDVRWDLLEAEIGLDEAFIELGATLIALLDDDGPITSRAVIELPARAERGESMRCVCGGAPCQPAS